MKKCDAGQPKIKNAFFILSSAIFNLV